MNTCGGLFFNVYFLEYEDLFSDPIRTRSSNRKQIYADVTVDICVTGLEPQGIPDLAMLMSFPNLTLVVGHKVKL